MTVSSPHRSAAAPASQGRPEPDDQALVDLLRKGDAQAGEVLVGRYHIPLIRYLRRVGGSEDVADDLHQQTWLSVLDHIDRFDAAQVPGGFKAWLFRIATNKVHDHWRSHGREQCAHQGLKLVTDQTSPQAGQRLDADEQRALLMQAIERLPDAQREVLMLRYYAELKFHEIADLLGCPLNTALGRMHNAIQRLRSDLAQAQAGPS
jgi:RNA polymerase sigma-70 factor (ECF subfamily)